MDSFIIISFFLFFFSSGTNKQTKKSSLKPFFFLVFHTNLVALIRFCARAAASSSSFLARVVRPSRPSGFCFSLRRHGGGKNAPDPQSRPLSARGPTWLSKHRAASRQRLAGRSSNRIFDLDARALAHAHTSAQKPQVCPQQTLPVSPSEKQSRTRPLWGRGRWRAGGGGEWRVAGRRQSLFAETSARTRANQ